MIWSRGCCLYDMILRIVLYDTISQLLLVWYLSQSHTYCYIRTSPTLQTSWTAFFFLSPLPIIEAQYNTIWWPCMIRCDLMMGVASFVRYDLVSAFWYDIHLRATTTMILSIRGVTIPIDLVSSATDSFRQCVVLFKPVPIPTSDLKSEILCQSSLQLCRTYRPPWTPRTPGKSPMPSSPHIIHTVTALALWPSTWSRSSIIRELSDLVAARQLKSSRVFHSNVTHTTILSTRGAQIPIDLVSSATDSIRWRVVLFKPVQILTLDPKSEFLCQSSYHCEEPTDSPWTPRTPGISPMPPSSHITRTAIVLHYCRNVRPMWVKFNSKDTKESEWCSRF